MTENGAFLQATIDREYSNLLNIITHYVVKMRLSVAIEARTLAEEILSETTIEALRNADNYDPERRAIPWLIGIACNRIRKRIDKAQRRKEKEISVHDLYPTTQANLNEDELFERLVGFTGEQHAIETQQQLEQWLAPLTPEERRIIELAILHELDGKAIARHLGISPGAARTRLSRALQRLRGHFDFRKGHA